LKHGRKSPNRTACHASTRLAALRLHYRDVIRMRFMEGRPVADAALDLDKNI